jgi:hypothetical protein
MQKLNARSDAGAHAEFEPGWNACDSDFVERCDRAGYACSIAYDRSAGGAATSASGAGRCSGSAAATSAACSSQIDGSGRHLSDGDGDRTA